MIWEEIKPGTGWQFAPYWIIQGRDCEISLEPRPHYCDRGNFIAKIFGPIPEVGLPSKEQLEALRRLTLDNQDGWPRYYFDLDRAKAEVEAWLKKRGQWIE